MLTNWSMWVIAALMLSQSCFANDDTMKVLRERNYFQFEIANYHTTRQSGQTLNVYIRYAYKPNLDTKLYPDYRKLRAQAMKYLEPTTDLPINVYWEIIATQLGKELMREYPLAAISVQLEVLDNPTGNEPGTHGPIYTLGDITPLDIHSPNPYVNAP